MNYHLHENGWTVIVDNFDLKKSTQEDINLIAKLIAKYTCVVLRGQFLSITEELRVLKMFKDPEPLYKNTDPDFKQYAADPDQDPEGIMCRVTGELRDSKPGLAGWNEELVWHCNHTHREDRRPIIWLSGIRGTMGSRTSWNNTILAYADLDQEMKDKIKDIKCIYAGGMKLAEDRGDPKYLSGVWTPPLVHINLANNVGMYFSPLQLHSFVGMSKEETAKITTPLFEHVTKEKYLYHHDWEDGDIVIAEQWLGIHKRWPFEGMPNRLLHRAALDFPDQNYT